MAKKSILISYNEYNSIEELLEKDKILLQKAIDATRGSYSPYSHFRVGAAVRLSNGVIVLGANQENAAYPSGLCAERTAIFAAHSNYPIEKIESIAITAVHNGKMLDTPTYPCGACRQVMVESETRSTEPIKIIIGGAKIIQIFESVKCMMPFAYDNLC